MTPLMRAMLDDILAHPRDDTLRLIYADLLDDAGESDRAELIRLQIREPNNPRILELIPGAPSWARRVTYRRGFIWRVDAKLETALDHLPELRKLHPVGRVQIVDEYSSYVQATTEYPAHYSWWHEDAVNSGMRGCVWDALEGYKAYTPQWPGVKDYDSDLKAYLALSRAVLKLTGDKCGTIRSQK